MVVAFWLYDRLNGFVNEIGGRIDPGTPLSVVFIDCLEQQRGVGVAEALCAFAGFV